jgi:hypothetical protein
MMMPVSVKVMITTIKPIFATSQRNLESDATRRKPLVSPLLAISGLNFKVYMLIAAITNRLQFYI